MSLDWADLEDRSHRPIPCRAVGRVANLVGMIVEVADLGAPVGSLCRIETGRHQAPVLCEVVGFRDDRLLVMPYQEARGIAPGCRATSWRSHLTVPVGPALLGRVVDGLGRPLDGGPALARCRACGWAGTPPSAMQPTPRDRRCLHRHPLHRQHDHDGPRPAHGHLRRQRRGQVRADGHAGPAGPRST